ncbi:MAG: hydantoinase/oxoprolinase family protein [bacterium]|nr:hydantoinase/oxoprolinase family protein [bacterium]
MSNWRLAVDIGGTFTDAVLLDASCGQVTVNKALTTPAAPLEGVKIAVGHLLNRAQVTPGDITAPIVHATTLVTNALIENKTGRAALVTTTGFGDTLLIRDEHRYDMYDLQIEFPDPPISRQLTFEIDERTAANGVVLQVPSGAELTRLTQELKAARAESVAVCLLNSYVNPANERLLASELRKALDVPVCASADISPQIREYPRMITAACNAATMPIIGPYLEELQKWLSAEGFGGSVLMMLSNGGVVSAEDAAAAPIRLVESGPAAGALAAQWFSRSMGEHRLLAFDMGGTTAKATLIEKGEPALTNTFEVARRYRFKKGSGFPVSVPSVDLVEIGAGGGSLAHLDQFGLLKVGPESSGADPGPACYQQGGQQPAVTDADVVLGLLDPKTFLGGDMPLDLSLAVAAIEPLADGLGLSTTATAAGIYEVVSQNMAAAARMHAVERGVDLRGVTVLAFGGAGPPHACRVAELLDSNRVVFPVNASVLSAFGTLVSPVRIDLARSMPTMLTDVVPVERDDLLDELRSEGRRVLLSAGVPERNIRYRYGIDARYTGQGNEITIWLGEGNAWVAPDDEVTRAFESEYRRIYGMTISDVAIEVVTWRLSARADPAEITTANSQTTSTPANATAVPTSTRAAVFGREQNAVEVPVYRRADLAVGATFAGPALVEERETTSVIRPGWDVTVAQDGSLIAGLGAR